MISQANTYFSFSLGTSAPERRGLVRRAFTGTVLLRCGDGPAIECKGLDISTKGIGLMCPVNLPVKTVVEVSLLLDKKRKHSLGLRGATAYSVFSRERNAFKVGVQFTDPSAQAIERIVAYVNQPEYKPFQ